MDRTVMENRTLGTEMAESETVAEGAKSDCAAAEETKFEGTVTGTEAASLKGTSAAAVTAAKTVSETTTKAGAKTFGKATIAKIAVAVVAICLIGIGAAAGVMTAISNNSDKAKEIGIAEIEEIEETVISDVLLNGVHPDEDSGADLEEVYPNDELPVESPYREEQDHELLDRMPAESNEFVNDDEILADGTFVDELSPDEIYAEVIDMYTSYYNDEISTDELSEWACEHEYPYDFSATFDESFNLAEVPYYRHESVYDFNKDREWNYAFYDINNDGIEEFFLSAGSLDAIWTWDGEKLVIVADDLFIFTYKDVLLRGISDGTDAFYEIQSDGKLVPLIIVDHGCEAEPWAKGYIGGDPAIMEELSNVWPYGLVEFADDHDYWNEATDEELYSIMKWGLIPDYELDWHPIF